MKKPFTIVYPTSVNNGHRFLVVCNYPGTNEVYYYGFYFAVDKDIFGSAVALFKLKSWKDAK